jgi:DedD protein
MNKDDLLNMDNKKNIKKPLVYGAIAFLVFIIAILGFAIYNNASSKQDNVVLPPQMKEETKQDTMFKEVPIENETNNQPKQENLTEKLLKEKPQEQTKTKNKEENRENKKQEKTTQKQIEQPAKKTTKTQPVTQPVTQPKPKTAVSSNNYYIQVAALMKYKKPNKKFLELLKKEGYNYRLYETYYVKNGKKIEVVKILVGPFSKNEVKKELNKIKANITQNAFIYKVK